MPCAKWTPFDNHLLYLVGVQMWMIREKVKLMATQQSKWLCIRLPRADQLHITVFWNPKTREGDLACIGESARLCPIICGPPSNWRLVWCVGTLDCEVYVRLRLSYGSQLRRTSASSVLLDSTRLTTLPCADSTQSWLIGINLNHGTRLSNLPRGAISD